MSDFPNQAAALKAADVLVETNKDEFNHERGVEVNDALPMLNKYYYIQAHGKKRTWTQSEHKSLRGVADVKSRKMLQDQQAFAEALGDRSPSKVAGVKDEVVGQSKMLREDETLKPAS